MESICPLTKPANVDWAAIHFPQQMRQPHEDDGYYLCPLREDDRLLWNYEAPHAAVWLVLRGDTVRLRQAGWAYSPPGFWRDPYDGLDY